MKIIKILIISEYFPPKIMGGGEISAYLLAKKLANLKNDGQDALKVSVLTSYFLGLKKFEIKDKIKIHRTLETGENPESFLSNIKRSLLFEKSLLKELEKLNKKENFDIIHCMNMTSIPAVKLKANKKATKSKFVVHINSPLAMCPKGDLIYKNNSCSGNCEYKKFIECVSSSKELGKVKNRFYIRYNPILLKIAYNKYQELKLLVSKFDSQIVISNYLKENLKGQITQKINVVPNIIELDDFINLKEKTSNKSPRTLFLGIYNIAKGPQILIEALKKTDYAADFYGYGPLKEYLIEKKKEYGLKKANIHDKVPYNNIPELYETHDIIVFPSVWPEPFGRIAIEAMASSRAIVASDIGGIKDIIKNNKTGILVKPNDAKELKKAIEKLMKDKKLREKLGKEGRKDAIKRYDGKIIAEQVKKIYLALLK